MRGTAMRRTAVRRTAVALLIAVMAPVTVVSVHGGGEAEQPTPTDDQASAERPLRVFVSVQPQKFFVDRIAGGEAQVSVVVPPGRSPSTYEPTTREVARLSEADVYFRVRVPFEDGFLPRVERGMEGLPIVDTTRNIEFRHLDEHGEQEHDPGHDEEGELDPHVWLGPREARTMAATIRDTLSELRPERAAFYEENYRELTAEIDELDARLAKELAPIEGRTLFVFHPAFGYFARTYGLRQEAIETGGREPSAAELERIIERAQEEEVRVIFVQPQFARSAADRAAEAIDGAVVSIDPLAEDWLANMERIAERIREGLE
ncbi:MAG: metal ABC transporter solute-binding protein, Zn/Mn family [Spirochaetota bacterium]